MKANLGNNWNGTQTIIEVNDDEVISRDIMPGRGVQTILDKNAAFRAEGRNPGGTHGRLAASIPIPVYTEWKKDWKSNHADKWSWKTFLTMKLNSRDYSYLKSNEMRL